MRLGKLRIIALMVIVMVGISIGTMPTAVSAVDNEEPISSGGTQTASEIEAYWTEERMRNAQPMPLPLLPGKPEPETGTHPFVYTSYQLHPDVTKLYKLPPFRSVGKLFFTKLVGGNFVCSASVVNAPNRDLVWTAGHCVNDPGVGFHTNFLFVPARHHGNNPFQTWTPRNAWTLVGWSQNGLLEYDMGALVMNPGGPGGGNDVQALGGLNFIANVNRRQHFHAIGYPAAPPFDGEHHHRCASSWAADDQPSGNPANPMTIGIGCDMTGGSSGGPWVVNYGTDNFINSNVSYGYAGVPDEYYGPYFGTGAQNLYNAASVD